MSSEFAPDIPDYKSAWYGKHPARRGPLPTHINNFAGTGGDDRFYAPGYGPPNVVESPGFQAPPQVPVNTTNAPTAEASSSPLDFLSGLPQWVWLAVAAGVIYWVFIKKGR